MHYVVTWGDVRDRLKDQENMQEIWDQSPRAVRFLCNMDFFQILFKNQECPADSVLQFLQSLGLWPKSIK
jgi:hypothetical protein